MPTPMSAYADIAARYKVDPADEEAVTRFFRDTAPALPADERLRIFNELLSAQEAEERAPKREQYTSGTPDVRPEEPTLAAVPPRAYNPHRDGDELDAIARSITRWVDHYFRLSGRDVTTSVTTSDSGQLIVHVTGPDAALLATKEHAIVESMKNLLSAVAHVQPVLDIIEFAVRDTEEPRRSQKLGKARLVPASEEHSRVVEVGPITVTTMSVEDAARALEKSRDEFIVFRDSDGDKVKVIYKRSKGTLGLIAPD